MKNNHSIVWLRRDLRLKDNTALARALSECKKVSCIFIFDEHILGKLPTNDRRVTFIWESLDDMNRQLRKKNSGPVYVFSGKPEEILPRIVSGSNIDAVYINHDYEPAALERDQSIRAICEKDGVRFVSSKDRVIFEKSEVIKSDGTPYKVFTAYKNQWLAELEKLPPDYFKPFSIPWNKIKPLPHARGLIQKIEQIRFVPTANFLHGGESCCKKQWSFFYKHLVDDYVQNRDLPGIDKTSYLSPFLRFGNISIRELVGKLKDLQSKGGQVFLSELIWREFFMMILFHFPHVTTRSFNPQYDSIRWQNRKDWFHVWCEGKTGFPIVDAGMRQLNETGFMHNRVRMITASFLVKHLHVDWRWGEKYFAEKLLDYEVSSNNGNWQWAAGTGVDAAPYFRIFNPTTQSKKFDPEGINIRRWIRELKDCNTKDIHEPDKNRRTSIIDDYPMPIIDLAKERAVCLEMYNYRSESKK